MIIMPVVVGLWWYKSIKYTSEKVLMFTMHLYRSFLFKNPTLQPKRAIMILGASAEFDRDQNPEIVDRESDRVELPQVIFMNNVFIKS